MSLSGSIKFRRKGKRKGRVAIISIRKFEVEGQLDAAEWAECLERLKALFKHYGIRLTSLK